jgi:hypothetical protein
MDEFRVGQGRRRIHAMTARAARRPPGVVVLTVVLWVALAMVGGPAGAQAVGLGTAESFAVLAGTTVTNTGPSSSAATSG